MTQENPEVPPERYQRSEFMRDARRFRVVEDDRVHAVGVVFPSGRAVVENLPESRFPSDASRLYVGDRSEEGVEKLRDVLDEATVEFIDASRQVREGDAVECPNCGGEVPLDEWTVYNHGGGSCPLCGFDTLPVRVREVRYDTEGVTRE